MYKVSIVVDKSMPTGQKANVAAIIMGQLALCNNRVYEDCVNDMDGTIHAGICVNTVVLDGSSNQLIALINITKGCGINCCVFTKTGQELSNGFSEYTEKIRNMKTISTGVVGVGLFGDAEEIKRLTKKFSLTK